MMKFALGESTEDHIFSLYYSPFPNQGNEEIFEMGGNQSFK